MARFSLPVLTEEQRVRHDLIVARIRQVRRRRALRLMWIRGCNR